MVSEPPFSPGLAPLVENTHIVPENTPKPGLQNDPALQFENRRTKSAHPSDGSQIERLEMPKSAELQNVTPDAQNPFEAAQEFVWDNLCRSFYVDHSTADVPEKTAQTARVERSTQNEWVIPAVDRSTQSASTQSESTQKSAAAGEKDNGTPKPENSGGPVRRAKSTLEMHSILKTASALPVPPLGQTAPGPIYPGLPRAGISPVAPGHATMTGIQQRPIGLDKPQDTRAAAMPGMPGHAATNVIDQQGALDPRGITVDGNNAASAIKFPKLASSVAQLASQTLEAARAADVRRLKSALSARQSRELGPTSPVGPPGTPGPAGPRDLPGPAHPGAELIKQALGDPAWTGIDWLYPSEKAAAGGWNDRLQKMRLRRGEPLDEQDQTAERSGPGSLIPNAALGLGAVSAGALGLAHGMASDGQISNIRQAISGYRPEAFTQGQLPPNRTGMTHYEATMSPAAQLKPFGIPVGQAIVKVRSDPKLMQALGTPSYTLKTPAEQYGVSGLSHYNMFANGAVPAYAHQLKARLSHTPVPAELGVPAGTTYSDWMGRKLEDFVATRTGQRINPFEVNLKFMPHDQQVGLMEQFHQSLSPEEQAFRMKAEDPGPGYADQVKNYLPKAETYANVRDTVKNVGITAGGAALGAAGGNLLHRAITGGDDQEEPGIGRTLSTVAGAGLGGGAAYLAGTPGGRELVQRVLAGIRGKAAADQAVGSYLPPGGPQEMIQKTIETSETRRKVAKAAIMLGLDPFEPIETLSPKMTAALSKLAGVRGKTAIMHGRGSAPAPSDIAGWKAKGCGERQCAACQSVSCCRCPTITHEPIPRYTIAASECPECRGRSLPVPTRPRT